jgi:hypothetical protein
MTPKFNTFPTFKEMYGRRAEYSQVRDILIQLDRTQTVLLLSQLSIHLALNRFIDDAAQTADLQAFLISNFISNELLAQLQKSYSHERLEDRQCFHPWQVLTLLNGHS